MGLYSSGDTTIQAPAAPNYGESMREVLQAQVDLAPQVYRSEAQFQPLYNVLQANQQAFQAQQSLNMARQAYPQIADIEAAYNAANRQAELGQLQSALPAYQQAFNQLTPGYAQAVAASGQLAQQSMQQALARPQFASFEAGVRDPYGMPVVAQPVQFTAPPVPPSLPQPPASQPPTTVRATATAQPVQADAGLSNRFLDFANQLKGNLPGLVPAPKDPGAPIEPQYVRSRGQMIVRNQSEIDAQNAKIAQYKTDLANFQADEAKREAGLTSLMQNYNPAAAFAPQQAKAASAPAAVATGTQPAPQALLMQQQQPAAMAQPAALPSTALQATPAGAYVGAVQDFTPNQNLPTNIQALDSASVNQYIGSMPGMSNYANLLAQMSQNELAAGKSLTAEEQRMADQSARAAYAARGTALGNQAVAAEVLNRADVANQRYQQRLQNAAQAAGTIQAIYQPALQQSLQRQQLANQFGLSQQELLQSAQAQRFGQAMGREQLAASTQQAAFQQALSRSQAQQQAYMAGTQAQAGLAQLGAGTMGQLQAAQAPVLQAFYKQPILQGQQAQSQQTGMMMQQQAGPQYFNPESQTGMGSIYGAYNSQMNLAAAQAQANAGKQAGMMGMLGNLGGSAIGAAGMIAMCWVAREVYGAENPKWLQFREWMLTEADDNLLDTYLTHGPKIAEFISDKPALKQMIKTWMDSKIS